ncbi:MAG: hypothetical protein KGJ21_07350, partial [Pseudomonadota bacterium]|nr:hypothetical protein [Pseudomonadota bacterium]
MRNILSFCLAALLLASCQTVNVPPPHPLSFTRYQPIYLNVGKIEIVDAYKSPMRLPNVEYLIPISPSDAMHSWVHDRLHPAGGDKMLEVIIHDGSVIATPLPQPDGFFTASPDKRYDAKLDVEMRVYGGGAMSEASITATATRSITIPADVSLAQRDEILHHFIAGLMTSMNAELEKN